MFQGFNNSVMGASHERSGLPCQDSSAFHVGEGYAVAVVADGHGSKKHFRSNIGSRCAVEAVLEAIERFYSDPLEMEKYLPQNHKTILKNIEKQVIALWNEKILKHLLEHPVTKAERAKFDSKEEFEEIPAESYYGTTLIAAVAGKDCCYGFQVGDGSLVAVFADGETSMIMDYEESNPANITASMCNPNAAAMFDDFYISDKQMLAMFVSTDGLYTSFGRDDDFLDYHTIIASQLTDLNAFETAVVKNLQKRSHYGTEDDISLACICDTDVVRAQEKVLKDRVAANKRAAAERKAKLLRR